MPTPSSPMTAVGWSPAYEAHLGFRPNSDDPGPDNRSEYQDDGFWAWLRVGQERGYVSEMVCDTHDGLPQAKWEDAQWDLGLDPCMPAVRLYGPTGRAGCPHCGVGPDDDCTDECPSRTGEW